MRKLFTHQDLALLTGIPRKVVAGYAALGLIQEVLQDLDGTRLYDDEAFHRLCRIDRLSAKGATLKDILMTPLNCLGLNRRMEVSALLHGGERQRVSAWEPVSEFTS